MTTIIEPVFHACMILIPLCTSGIFCALDYRKRYFALAEDSMTFISWVVIKDVVVDTACGIAMKL